jgi:hypothetical protein
VVDWVIGQGDVLSIERGDCGILLFFCRDSEPPKTNAFAG